MIIVHPDSTLNIGPGVEVNFQDHYKFIVNGLLNAEGTEQDSILFTTEYTLMGWNGIRFLGAVDSSHLSYCIFEYGRALGVEMNTDSWGGAIFCEYSNPVIRHCTFRDNYAEWYGGAMEVDYSSPVIDHCVFTDNTAASSAG
ncbi:MAG: hypothetical protein H8E17_03220, partial [Deltaproteobacteria bacterium]|nr:hypothetical protein [Deltaproteobacteria bacterium]